MAAPPHPPVHYLGWIGADNRRLNEGLQAHMNSSDAIDPMITIAQPQPVRMTQGPGFEVTDMENVHKGDAVERSFALWKECEVLKARIQQMYADENARAGALRKFMIEAHAFTANARNLTVYNAYQDLYEAATYYEGVASRPMSASGVILPKISQLKREMQIAVAMLQNTGKHLQQGRDPEDGDNCTPVDLHSTLLFSTNNLNTAVVNLLNNASDFDKYLVKYCNGRKQGECQRVKPRIRAQITPWWDESSDPEGVRNVVENLQKIFVQIVKPEDVEIKQISGDVKSQMGNMLLGVVGVLNAFITFMTKIEQEI